MFSQLVSVASLVGFTLGQQTISAKSYTGWDCCKPLCASVGSNQGLLNSRGAPQVCDRNNNALEVNQGIQSTNGCNTGGNGFMCDNFQPIPVSDSLSYGFAIQVGGTRNGDNPNCCKCYEITWRSGSAQGKKMIVQNVTPGTASGSVVANDMIILTPGGGVGPSAAGCTNQYGSNFNGGSQYGGVTSRDGCANLPANLQGGCYWRYNWAKGSITNWTIQYHQVDCPERLTDITGCSA